MDIGWIRPVIIHSLLNPRLPEVFFVTRPLKGVVATRSLDFLYVTHDTLYLLPVYRYVPPLSTDTKMSTIELHMTSL